MDKPITRFDPSTRVPKNTGVTLFFQTVVGRAYPRVIGQQREKSWIFFETFLPFIAMASYVFIYRAIGAPEEYIGFVVVGGAMTAFWLNILWSMSSQLYWEKEMGNLSLYIMAPNSLMAILLGMALGGLVASTMRAAVIILIGGLLFSVQFNVSSYLQLLFVFFLTMTALYGLGMMTSSVFLLLSREAWHLASLAQEPVYLVSGFYFPIKSLNFWVAIGASLIPLTLGMDAMRQLVFTPASDFGFLSVQLEIQILVGLSAIFLIGAYLLLRHMEKLAITEGRITESRR